MIVRCTARAQRRLGLQPTNLANVHQGGAGLAEWYCNVVVLERRPVILVTHARTLFAVWMLAAGKASHGVFWRELRAHARRALGDAGVASADAGLVLDEGRDAVAKTLDRGVLGSMVDYARMGQHHRRARRRPRACWASSTCPGHEPHPDESTRNGHSEARNPTTSSLRAIRVNSRRHLYASEPHASRANLTEARRDTEEARSWMWRRYHNCRRGSGRWTPRRRSQALSAAVGPTPPLVC